MVIAAGIFASGPSQLTEQGAYVCVLTFYIDIATNIAQVHTDVSTLIHHCMDDSSLFSLVCL